MRNWNKEDIKRDYRKKWTNNRINSINRNNRSKIKAIIATKSSVEENTTIVIKRVNETQNTWAMPTHSVLKIIFNDGKKGTFVRGRKKMN